MIYAKAGDAAMVYTGDYNMTPDRHLGAAQIDRLKLDLLITEYGPTSNYRHVFISTPSVSKYKHSPVFVLHV
jgi:integrator complex subunit 11